MIEVMTLLIALAAPAEASTPAPAETASPLAHALRVVDQRIAILEDLRARRAAGELVSVDAIRSAGRVPTGADETLEREQAAIEDLRDAIRVARSAQRRPERIEVEPASVDPATAPADAEAAETTPEPPSEPLRTGRSMRLRLAEARYRSGDFTAALTLYEAAAGESAEDTWSRLRCGRCLERLGRIAEARGVYEALVAEHAEDTWAEAARWSLGALDLATSTAARKDER